MCFATPKSQVSSYHQDQICRNYASCFPSSPYMKRYVYVGIATQRGVNVNDALYTVCHNLLTWYRKRTRASRFWVALSQSIVKFYAAISVPMIYSAITIVLISVLFNRAWSFLLNPSLCVVAMAHACLDYVPAWSSSHCWAGIFHALWDSEDGDSLL